MKNLPAILALAILLTVGLACSDTGEKTTTTENSNTTTTKTESSSDVTVEYIKLLDEDDEEVTSYKPSDKKHSAKVKFSETGAGKVRGVFTAVNADGQKNVKILDKELEMNSSLLNTATFYMTLDKGFPVGEYKLDVYLNGKLLKTHNYKVQ